LGRKIDAIVEETFDETCVISGIPSGANVF
jgi:hypothetical protein